MHTDTPDYLAFAHQLADSARDITLSYFRRPLDIDNKQDGSPVTAADKATESALRAQISERFPGHAILGEEFDDKHGDSPYEWILDPIDGTRNFMTGYPLYGTLICLLKYGEPVVSIIDVPAMDERFFASADSPAHYRKGQQTQVLATNPCVSLADANLFSTDYGMFTAAENRQARGLRQAVNMVRYNGDCYLYAMLAAGWIDIVLEADLKPYDFLPLKLIVEQAGGIITDWQGNTLNKNSSGQLLAAANSSLHQHALSTLTNG